MTRFGYLLPLSLPLMAVAGFELGGAWNYLTPVFSYTALPFLDILSGEAAFKPDAEEIKSLERDPLFRVMLYLAAAAHFTLLVFGAWAVTHAALSWYALAGLVLSIGTVSGSLGIVVAHELGHHVSRFDRTLSRALLATVCYMHFYIEHNRGHHSMVGTDEDPASARYGESVYRFLPRTLKDSFIHAWQLERERLAKAGQGPWQWGNPMLWCVAWPLLVALGFGLVFGAAAVLYFFVQAFIAVILLELVNYVEHYGLTRQPLAGGGYERVTAVHSWNSSHRLSTYFLFNLTRHSHHHIQSQRHYQALAHEEASPQLPVGYAGMLMLSLVPPLWERVMHPRLARYCATTASNHQ